MIRVNLLAPERASRWRSSRAARRLAARAVLVAWCASMPVGLWWHVIRRDTARAEARLAADERALARWQEIAARAERAASRTTELSNRLALIARLRGARHAPVAQLAAISRSVPDGLWLIELTDRSGRIELDGRAMSLAAVSDFVERLQRTGIFDVPIEIVSANTEAAEDEAIVRFKVTAGNVGAPGEVEGRATARIASRGGE
jgi:Tfp pilus assembly protein PilN